MKEGKDRGEMSVSNRGLASIKVGFCLIRISCAILKCILD